MRGWKVIFVLVLAGCGVNQGWNPNYQFGNNPYGEYRAAREAALVADGGPMRDIPVARPFYAPKPADIAGQDPVPVPRTMAPGGLIAGRRTTVVPAGVQPEQAP